MIVMYMQTEIEMLKKYDEDLVDSEADGEEQIAQLREQLEHTQVGKNGN